MWSAFFGHNLKTCEKATLCPLSLYQSASDTDETLGLGIKVSVSARFFGLGLGLGLDLGHC